MTSRIECNRCKRKNNYNKHNFLTSMAEGKPLLCKYKKCDGELSYIVHHSYPNKNNEEHEFVLEGVRKIEASDRYHPFLLKLKDKDTGHSEYLLQYWVLVKDKKRENWRYGQYAPMLKKEQIDEIPKLVINLTV